MEIESRQSSQSRGQRVKGSQQLIYKEKRRGKCNCNKERSGLIRKKEIQCSQSSVAISESVSDQPSNHKSSVDSTWPVLSSLLIWIVDVIGIVDDTDGIARQSRSAVECLVQPFSGESQKVRCVGAEKIPPSCPEQEKKPYIQLYTEQGIDVISKGNSFSFSRVNKPSLIPSKLRLLSTNGKE